LLSHCDNKLAAYGLDLVNTRIQPGNKTRSVTQ
jgi:hypothetical protein